MQVIPVIDVLGGVAVAARLGDRKNYQPLQTPLAKGSDPVAIACGLMALHPFETIYIADLDAIEGRPGNHGLIELLREALPTVQFWFDCAVSTPNGAAELLTRPGVRVVVGSESVKSIDTAEKLFKLASHHCALSLDLDAQGFVGPFELLTTPQIWPRSIIAMSLPSVGSGKGPAMKYIKDVVRLAGKNRRVFAAGGIRDLEDCRAVSAAGASGVLIATALHSQNIKADDLGVIAGL